MIARPAHRVLPWLVVLAAVVVPLAAGCGGGAGDQGSIAGHQFRLSGTQRNAQFAVGSEGFTEQEILGAITVQALRAANATVIDRTGLGGNEAVRRALVNDEVDLYWEYTATGWLVFLDETDFISDPQKQYEAVAKEDLKENGIEWLEPAPGNDTYAIAASEKTSKELGVKNVSDLGRLIKEHPDEATLCLNNDDNFRSRFDGLPGLERAYGFQFPEDDLVEVSLDAVPGAVEDGEICNFGVVFTTSGLVQESNLQLLKDDKDFFAVYNPSLTMQQETLKNYPQLREIFAPISKKLDTETLRKLNYAVEVEGKTPEAVAGRWLRKNGFVE